MIELPMVTSREQQRRLTNEFRLRSLSAAPEQPAQDKGVVTHGREVIEES